MSGAGTGVGPIRLVGRLAEASNATFLAELDGRAVVYKPVAGEAPLWDFPAATLGRREVAAFQISEASGARVVPPTRWVDDGPLGPGSVQDWVESDERLLADLVPVGQEPEGWHAVLEGVDEQDRDVVLVHCDEDSLRRVALFDAVLNNADRKAPHLVATAGGGVLGVDHGVCFHVDPKLRTILWGWAGQPFSEQEVELLQACRAAAPDVLSAWLAPREVAATVQRCAQLLAAGHHPLPGEGWPAIPWPPI